MASPEKPTSFYAEGRCGACGAELRVLAVDAGITFVMAGKLITPSLYECTGAARHKWKDLAATLRYVGQQLTALEIRLVRAGAVVA